MIRKLLFCLFFVTIFLFDLSAKENKIFHVHTSTKNQKGKILPEKKLGIKVESLRLTAYGKLVDFRFRVLDEEKASVIFSPKLKPYLTDKNTNSKFYIPNTPKVGSLRSYGTPVKNRVYFMLFANNGALKKGSTVSIVIGDTTIENLVVE